MSEQSAPAPADAPAAPLPLWPLTVMFGLMPLQWALGGFYLGWSVFGLVLLALLVTRGRVELPFGTVTWLVFLLLVLLSATRLDRVTAYLTFGLRLGFMATALVVCVYVYNLAREGVAWHRLLRPLGLFWLGVVALGWLGVLMPTLALTTPVEVLLPGNIAGERYIQALTHVRANEFNPLSPAPIYRTAAPYPYTNNWGTAYALLVPCVIAYLASVRGGAFRVVLIVSLPLSLVPAFMTLNRGMFLGLGIGLTYLGVRALIRGNAKLIASIGVLLLLVWVVSLVVPVQDMIDARVSSTDTNTDRMDLYIRTWEAVTRSPLLGYGQPSSVDTIKVVEPLGTQGMFWQVLYSHGIPALLLFLFWLVMIARRLAAAVSPAGQWLGVLPVIALVVIPVYAYIDPNMSVLFFAIGAALAAIAGPVNRAPTLPAGTGRPVPLVDRPRWDPPTLGAAPTLVTPAAIDSGRPMGVALPDIRSDPAPTVPVKGVASATVPVKGVASATVPVKGVASSVGASGSAPVVPTRGASAQGAAASAAVPVQGVAVPPDVPAPEGAPGVEPGRPVRAEPERRS
ncbi:O-antigen ligase domain-containing protein [Micromonospora sp. WMMD882]|uniref:O-antigen ligase family protein n=1 Tax=Micromonospora sp. WMMD882 TaxID=3015151 RepID=UPI00248B6DE7|nr:O-antigen ligase family protein [Micromonospora sp. WMMD882]WBB77285.1 O-antigen ligase domain-containing protein [Micromonospora sp. WMMD882]